MLDITKLDAISESNKGDELELFYKGESTGVKLLVLGSSADAVRLHAKDSLKDYARKNSLAEKRGTTADFQVALIEKLEDRNVENALVRVVGWVGQKGEFSKEVMRGVLERNPQWVDDVLEFSDFLEKSSTNTSSNSSVTPNTK